MIVHRNQHPRGPVRNQPSNGNGVFMVGLIVLLLVSSIGVWGLKARNFLGKSGKQAYGGSLQSATDNPNKIMSSQTDVPGEILSSQTSDVGGALASTDSPASEGTVILESKAPTRTGMPDVIREWLEHLRKAEAKREEIANRQVSEAVSTLLNLRSMGGAGADMSVLAGDLEEGQTTDRARDPQAPCRVASSAGGMMDEWNRLARAFDDRPAPPECVDLKAMYDQVLRETATMIQEIVAVVENIGDDPMSAIGKLERMRGKSPGRIDSAAMKVDRGVETLCNKYETPKWFEVKSDFGGGSLSSLGL